MPRTRSCAASRTSRATPTSTVCSSVTNRGCRRSSSRVPTIPSASPSCTLATASRWTRTRTRPYARTRRHRCWSRCAVASGRADAIVSAGNTARACSPRRSTSAAAGRQARGARVRPPRMTSIGPGPARVAARRGRHGALRGRRAAQFALMGSAYARRISKVPNPGRTPQHGTGGRQGWRDAGRGEPAAARAASDRLRRQRRGQRPRARGGRDRVRGLRRQRGAQAAGRRVGGARRRGAGGGERKLVWRVGLRLLSQGIERVHALTDFSRYGGSPILGFDRLFIKCHGRSRARAVGTR